MSKSHEGYVIILRVTVLLRINARGVYLIFLFLGGAFIRGGRLKEGGVY